MKILHVYPYYPPATGFGGVIPVLEATVEHLTKRGHRPVVYTTDTEGPDGRLATGPITQESGVRIKRFPNVSNWLAANMTIPLPIGFRRALRRTISEFDVAHVHGFSHLPAVMTARAAKRHSVPYILTPHGAINLPDGVSDGYLRRGFDTTLGEYIINRADVLVALTSNEERRIREAYPGVNRIERIPNGIDPSEFTPPKDAVNEFIQKYDLTDTFRVTFIGRLHYKKGLDIVAEVAEKLDEESAEGRPVQFVIIGGDDGYEEEFRQQISVYDLDNVSMLGYVSDREVKLAHAAADVFLLPSYSEGQPVSVLEACAASTPVVISDACSIPEVADANAGAIVQTNATEVANALRHLIRNPELRYRQGANAREMIEDQFSWEQVLDQLEWLYSEL